MPIDEARTGPILYPLIWHQTVKVTPRQFCEITDAAYEARRRGTEVRLVGLSLARGVRTIAGGAVLDRIAEAWQRLDLPVIASGQVNALPDFGERLGARLHGSAFSRRRHDLPDLLVATAADAIAADRIYVGADIVPRRHLESMQTIAPLCRLYGPDPFYDPPAHAKLRPAGSDALWFLAFITGLTSAVQVTPDERDSLRREVKAILGDSWRRLHSAGLTRRGLPPTTGHQVRVSVRQRQPASDWPQGLRISIPLFGSRSLQKETRCFVAAVAGLPFAGRPNLIVDDVTPRFLYSTYDVPVVQRGFRDLAADLSCNIAFLSESSHSQLGEAILQALDALLVDDLVAASRTGVDRRARGGFTGYDALHLAVMASLLTTCDPGLVAVRGGNLRALGRLTRFVRIAGQVVVTGIEELPLRRQASPGSFLLEFEPPHRLKTQT